MSRAWVLDEDAAEPIVRAAADAGVTFYDTADTYSGGASEVATGRLLGKLFSRDEVVVATKVFIPWPERQAGPRTRTHGLSRKHILAGIDASLQRLGMDYVDLYQIHRWDYRTPIEETMEALHDVVQAGKARYIGASSMFAWQFAKAQHVAERNGWTPFVSMQNHYNLIYREEEREMIPLCLDQGVGVIPWSPLARGVLAGSRTPGRPAAHHPGRFRLVHRHAVHRRRLRRGGPGGRGGRSAGACRRRRSRWPGCCTGPGSPRRSWARPSSATWRTRIAAEELELSEEEIKLLEEPYVPHAFLPSRRPPDQPVVTASTSGSTAGAPASRSSLAATVIVQPDLDPVVDEQDRAARVGHGLPERLGHGERVPHRAQPLGAVVPPWPGRPRSV